MYVHLMILWKLHYINFCGNNNDDGDDDDDDNYNNSNLHLYRANSM